MPRSKDPYLTMKDNFHNKLVTNDNCGDYKITKKIGMGTFGIVYEALHQLSRQKVALKRIMVTEDKIETENYIKSAKLEAIFLKIASSSSGSDQNSTKSGSAPGPKASDFFLECIETFYDRKRFGQYCIVTNFLAGETLMDRYIKKRRTPSIKTVVNLAKQFFQALIFLKSKKLIHTDIKPENIVFDFPTYKKDGLTKWDDSDRIKGLVLVSRSHGFSTPKMEKSSKTSILRFWGGTT